MIEIYKEPEYALFSNLCSSLKMGWITESFFVDKVQEVSIPEEFLIRALKVPSTPICNGAFRALHEVSGKNITKALMFAMKESQYLESRTDLSGMVKKREDFYEVLAEYIEKGDSAFVQSSD